MKYRAPMSSHPAVTLKHSPRGLIDSLRLSAFVKATSSRFEKLFHSKGTIFSRLHHCSTGCKASGLSSVAEISFSADVQSLVISDVVISPIVYLLL